MRPVPFQRLPLSCCLHPGVPGSARLSGQAVLFPESAVPAPKPSGHPRRRQLPPVREPYRRSCRRHCPPHRAAASRHQSVHPACSGFLPWRCHNQTVRCPPCPAGQKWHPHPDSLHSSGSPARPWRPPTAAWQLLPPPGPGQDRTLPHSGCPVHPAVPASRYRGY